MTSREHIIELARRLEKAKNKLDAAKVQTILESLTNVEINIALLKQTELGKKVNSIRKSEAFKTANRIKEIAETLLAKWKVLVTAEKKQKKALKKLQKNGTLKNGQTNGHKFKNKQKVSRHQRVHKVQRLWRRMMICKETVFRMAALSEIHFHGKPETNIVIK